MIYLKKSEYSVILQQARREYDNECCGFLAGVKKDGDVYINKAYALVNVDNSSEHFSMNPKEQFEKVKLIRKENMELVGNYHSHPHSPSRPSEEDKRLAFDPNIIYAILSLQNEEKPVFNLFKINKNNVEKLEYEII